MEVPSRTVPNGTDVVVVAPGVRLRMGAPDAAWGWVVLGAACLDAAAEVLWPAWASEGPDGWVDWEDMVSAERAAALRSIAESAIGAAMSTGPARRRRWWRW
ncbi:hypothetical protein ACG83_21965 [Frankia sp. R43]|nr:hypothetical protein ACG83_21965 [Frankia sp. R43]